MPSPATGSFQSAPGHRPGENGSPDHRRVPRQVSIRTRAPTRGKHRRDGHGMLLSGFNPHPGTDPGKTRTVLNVSALDESFQSAPGHRPGENTRIGQGLPVGGSFNPHPGTDPGKTQAEVAHPAHLKVSIRTRAPTRGKPPYQPIIHRAGTFQSAPGHRPGENGAVR